MDRPRSAGFRVGLVQMRCAADRDANLEKATALVNLAADQGAQVVCLPELFLSPYFCQTQDVRHFDLTEPIPGPTTTALSALAKRRAVVLVVPIFERRSAGVYHNSAAVLDADGAYLGKYRKMHIPEDPSFEEKFYFTPGDLGFKCFDTRYGRIGVLICWDQWFPEAARLTAMMGADILFYPTAIGWLDGERETEGPLQLGAWQTVQRGHAVANGVHVAAVNRVGREGVLDFWGHSFLAGPLGQTIVEAGVDETVLVADVDLRQTEAVRQIWPFYRDRRIDAYGDITKRLLVD